MKVIIAVLVMILTFVQGSDAMDKAHATSRLFHDERCVKDMATLSLLSIVHAEQETWATASVVPNPNSGKMVGKGAYIDISTGKLVEPVGTRYVTNIYGNLDHIHVLTGSLTQNSIPYKWELTESLRDPETRVRYSPYASGGVVLFRYNAEKTGSEQFRPTYLFPDEWTADVPAALAYIKAHADLFDSSSVGSHQERLHKLLEETNPLIAISACRALAQFDEPGTGFIDTAFAKTTGIRQATYTFLLLKYGMQGAEEKAMQRMEKRIDMARITKDMSDIALGSLVALDEPPSQSCYKNGLRLLKRILERRSTLPRQAGDNAYLDTIAALMEQSGLLRGSK